MSKIAFETRVLLTGAVVVVLLVCAGAAWGKYSGGLGTEAEPYEIGTIADWQELMDSDPDWEKHFVLIADLDMNGVAMSPVGNYPDTFTGVFDGNDHVIRNVDIDTPDEDYVGLFGYVGPGAHLRNVGIADADIVGDKYVGGLVGYNAYRSSIINCHAVGSVTGVSYVGGLVGYNAWYISIAYRSSIINSYATGSVTGGSYVGGLVGYSALFSSIINCYASGSVSGVSSVGGLAGRNAGHGSISGCYASGPVSGGSSVGGLVGFNDPDANIGTCYATGSVSGGGYYAGGLVGRNFDGSISNCYSTGSVSGGERYVGGMVGYNGRVASNDDGSISICFWDVETSGQEASAGGKGLTTTQMKSLATYSNAGWAGKGWVIEDGLDYPRLAWEGTGGVPIPEAEPMPLLGSGTEEDPYQVWTADDFALVSWHTCVLDKHIKLMANLDLAGIALYPIGDLAPFNGVFDGNDHIIRNADINMPGSDRVGLFGYVSADGQIHNVGVEDAAIVGYGRVGGLVGRNHGNISDSYVTGWVNGQDDVGGLVGYNGASSISNCYSTSMVNGRGDKVGSLVGCNGGGSISNCHTTGSVTSGANNVGGLVGFSRNFSSISNCCATGSVRGQDAVGGLAGRSHGTIRNCYATGSVSGNDDVGGLVGSSSGSISDSHATGWITGKDEVGGLVGYNGSDSIRNCYSTGSVSGYDFVGGLVGHNNCGYIANTYATGPVSGDGCVGGLVGYDEGYSSIRNSYATGSVDGDYTVGGLVGGQGYSRRIANCYATGSVSGNFRVGGLVGRSDRGSITNCYAAGSVSGDYDVGGLVGDNYYGSISGAHFLHPDDGGGPDNGHGWPLTDTQMRQQESFVDWDFIDVWDIGENQTYPYLMMYAAGDINHDGVVDFRDLAHLGQRWLSGAE